MNENESLPSARERDREIPAGDVGRLLGLGRLLLIAAILLLSLADIQGETNAPHLTAAEITVHAKKRVATAYANAHREWLDGKQNGQLAWQFARACFDMAEFADSIAERAEFANQGIAAAEQALRLDPNSAAAHYYLGMNLGQLARTKGLGALRLVNRMKNEFIAARTLDQKIDFAGPDRNLGMLYRDAPSIGSVGNRKEARKCLERAVELAPEYPENRLALIEGLTKWKDIEEARRQLELLDKQWDEARARFSGPEWDTSWLSWEQMRNDLRKKLDAHGK